jgi:hypothetical protein
MFGGEEKDEVEDEPGSDEEDGEVEGEGEDDEEDSGRARKKARTVKTVKSTKVPSVLPATPKPPLSQTLQRFSQRRGSAADLVRSPCPPPHLRSQPRPRCQLITLHNLTSNISSPRLPSSPSLILLIHHPPHHILALTNTPDLFSAIP